MRTGVEDALCRLRFDPGAQRERRQPRLVKVEPRQLRHVGTATAPRRERWSFRGAVKTGVGGSRGALGQLLDLLALAAVQLPLGDPLERIELLEEGAGGGAAGTTAAATRSATSSATAASANSSCRRSTCGLPAAPARSSRRISRRTATTSAATPTGPTRRGARRRRRPALGPLLCLCLLLGRL